MLACYLLLLLIFKLDLGFDLFKHFGLKLFHVPLTRHNLFVDELELVLEVGKGLLHCFGCLDDFLHYTFVFFALFKT